MTEDWWKVQHYYEVYSSVTCSVHWFDIFSRRPTFFFLSRHGTGTKLSYFLPCFFRADFRQKSTFFISLLLLGLLHPTLCLSMDLALVLPWILHDTIFFIHHSLMLVPDLHSLDPYAEWVTPLYSERNLNSVTPAVLFDPNLKAGLTISSEFWRRSQSLFSPRQAQNEDWEGNEVLIPAEKAFAYFLWQQIESD